MEFSRSKLSAYVKNNEKILGTARSSKFAIVVTWLCVPFIFGLYYILTLPVRIKRYIANRIADQIVDSVLESAGGTGNFEFPALFDFEIPSLLRVLIAVPFLLLLLAWLCWAWYNTGKLLSNELVYTDTQIFAYSSGRVFSSGFEDVRDITVERSLWGKIFRYGNLNISSKNSSITVRAVKDPLRWKQILMNRTDMAQKYHFS